MQRYIRSPMEIQPILNIDGHSLFIWHLSNNFYHLNIVDRENKVHHFEGIYSSPQAAIDRGMSVIETSIGKKKL